MAVIQCVTPSTAIETEEPVNRQVHERRSIDAAELGKIDIVPDPFAHSAGLKKIQVSNIADMYPIAEPISPNFTELL